MICPGTCFILNSMTVIVAVQLGLKTIKDAPTYDDAEVESFEWKRPDTT